MTSPTATDSRFPFGDWQVLRASFLDVGAGNPLVDRQLERSSRKAADVVADPDAWRELTPVTKADLLADQEADAPYGRRRRVATADLGLVVESSGSTGQGREVHYLSRADTELTASSWARYLAQMGISPGDVVALCFPIGMAGGGVRHLLAYSHLGATVLRVGGLSAERKIEAIRHYRATTLVATPAYVDRLGVVAGEAGVAPRELGIRRIVCATQSVSVDWVRATEELWGARLYEWYGTSAGIAAFACARGMVGPDGERGTLHWNPAIAVQEVVDPATGRHVDGGRRGELVGTPLINAAEPLFRIATGDEVCFRAPGSCPCGSDWPGIESGTVRRLDAMLKVKGVNLWPAVVDAAVLGRDDVLDYRVRVWQDDSRRERLSLDVLVGGDADAAPLEGTLREDLRERTGLSFELGLVDARARWTQATGGEAGKATRWVDERGRG